MSRPPIPSELKRAVLVEVGHRCAIPRCGQTEIDIHHIVPWETCKKHEYENLIALCPICHRRAHKDEIDRKSLKEYKARLIQEAMKYDPNQFGEKIIEIKRCISEIDERQPGYDFKFEFPDFEDPSERIVSKNLEAWGNELLVDMRQFHDELVRKNPEEMHFYTLNWLRGKYEVVRRDAGLIKYTLIQYSSGAAHRGQCTRVQNFILNPFQPVTIENLLIEDKLVDLSLLVREKLLLENDLDSSYVERGTHPLGENFCHFNFRDWGMTFTFPEYQIGCYAIGEQEVFLEYGELNGIVDPQILKVARENVL
ncbi:HNH endonuclease [Nitrosomonas communis]|uniref:HNH nuclease domain-containing protein n=1 Tax=Nitrosomonas communis TaxID=44574 RepID=A0A1I4Q2K4_9PROT|nr:HNH endonuclease [Nitrosomonas communis]SFM34287.1 Protein of unknown function [Nitrosomonas communis]